MKKNKNKRVKLTTVLGNIHFIWMLLFFVLPFIFLIFASLKEYMFGTPLAGVSILNYSYLFQGSLFFSTLITSLLLSAIATALTIICSIIVVTLIYTLNNNKVKNILVYVMVTTCVLGVIPRTFANSFFLSGNETSWYSNIISLYSVGGILLTYLCIYAPLSVLILITFRSRINNDFTHVSRELGANNFQVQKMVILPMMKRGIMIASLLTFLLIIGDVTIIDIVGGSKYYTTPMYIIDRIKIDDWGTASAAAIIMITIVIFLLTATIIYLLKNEEN